MTSLDVTIFQAGASWAQSGSARFEPRSNAKDSISTADPGTSGEGSRSAQIWRPLEGWSTALAADNNEGCLAGGKTAVTALMLGAPDSGMNQQQESEEFPMQQRRTAEEPAPPRTYRPLRQIVLYLCITYGLTLAIALALPHAGITPLIAIAFPVIAVALTVAFTVPRGQRRAIWAAVGFNPRRGRGLLIAVLGPAVIIAVSFGVAAAFGVVRFPGLAPGFGLAVLNLTVTIIIFAVSSSARRSAGAATCCFAWPSSPPGGARLS
jgi:hypothetical protein